MLTFPIDDTDSDEQNQAEKPKKKNNLDDKFVLSEHFSLQSLNNYKYLRCEKVNINLEF